MPTKSASPQGIDEYTAGLPEDVQNILARVRLTIQQAAPDAQETIKYKMPTFTLNGKNLVHFGAYKKHIGFFPPVSAANAALKKKVEIYEGPKGALQFPLDKPMPLTLISRIVKQRVKEIAKGEK